MSQTPAQSLAVKRAEVEFHNFASLGEPERAMRVYAEENTRRGAVLRNHVDFIGPLTPFLEIGANAGHTSYMLANEFGAGGFALDLSADSLRHGMALQDAWGLSRAPVRLAGDAVNLPFADGSLRMVCAFQMLSQFMNVESVFLEVKRVLAPGGVFLFAEEPLKRLLTLGLYRCPYYETMKPWERRLYKWGLLGFLVRDVIGAGQEESFGIRQNHSLDLKHWREMLLTHFAEMQCDVFVRSTGWAESLVRRLAVSADPYHSDWRAARLLGGTLAAVVRKEGEPPADFPGMDSFERFLRCPDCHAPLTRDSGDTLSCATCGYHAPNEGGVFNLLPSAEKAELYPGDRPDIIDFCLPSHAQRLLAGFHELEGSFGNKYRWIEAAASARLDRVKEGPQRIRIRGHAHETPFDLRQRVTIEVQVNGTAVGNWTIERPGLFVLEADVPEAPEYRVDIQAAPLWRVPNDERMFTVNISMIRLVPRE